MSELITTSIRRRTRRLGSCHPRRARRRRSRRRSRGCITGRVLVLEISGGGEVVEATVPEDGCAGKGESGEGGEGGGELQSIAKLDITFPVEIGSPGLIVLFPMPVLPRF